MSLSTRSCVCSSQRAHRSCTSCNRLREVLWAIWFNSGIVLSGMLPAGVGGLRAIKARGGFTMAQDRVSSGSFEMPAAAIDLGKAEIVLPPERLALVLTIIAEWWRSEGAAQSYAPNKALKSGQSPLVAKIAS